MATNIYQEGSKSWKDFEGVSESNNPETISFSQNLAIFLAGTWEYHIREIAKTAKTHHPGSPEARTKIIDRICENAPDISRQWVESVFKE